MNFKVILTFIVSALLIACGEDFDQGSNLSADMNGLRLIEAEDNLSNKEITLMRSFCSSLQDKKISFISNYVGDTSKRVSMAIRQGSCDKAQETPSNIEVQVKLVGDDLYFGSGSVFPKIITSNSEELLGLCGKVTSSDDVSRVVSNAATATWFSLANSRDIDCSDENVDEDTICLKIVKGKKSETGEGYRIDRIDHLKTTSSVSKYRGVVYSRQTFDSSGCENNDFVEKTQTIKL